jgi:hypothetical protein
VVLWRGFPRKISVEDAEEKLLARVSESRGRGAETLKHSSLAAAARHLKAAGINFTVYIVYYIAYDIKHYTFSACIIYDIACIYCIVYDMQHDQYRILCSRCSI